MNNRYVLPICFAVAAHGALLFGITKNSRPARLMKEVTQFIVPDLRPPPEEEPAVVEELERADSIEKVLLNDPPLRQLEPVLYPVAEAIMFTPPRLPPIGAGAIPSVGGGFDPLAAGTRSAWRKVVTGAMLDNPPRARFQAAPFYPPAAKHAGMRGEVVVEFLVDDHGRVVEPRVVRSSDLVFEEATLKGVAKWQFEPGRRGGKIVSFRMMVPVVFNLSE